MTGKQIVKEIRRIRKELANLAEYVSDPTEKGLVVSAATDEAAYRVLLNQAPLSKCERNPLPSGVGRFNVRR